MCVSEVHKQRETVSVPRDTLSQSGKALSARRVPRPRVDHDARRSAFLRSAAETLNAEGLQVSMEDIALKAGAQKIMLYRAFPSRLALMEGILEEVEQIMSDVYALPWRGYGTRASDLYARAKTDKALFIAAFRTLRQAPELADRRRRLFAIMRRDAYTLLTRSAQKTAGVDQRARQAARTLSSLFADTLVNWLEDRDGLDEDRRIIWWSNIMYEWARITRIAYELERPFRQGSAGLAVAAPEN